MVADPLADWWVHTTQVARYQGSGAKGDVYATAVSLMGLVDDSNKLIVNAAGQQTVSSARVFYPAGTAAIPLKSLVTLAGPFLNRTSQVIAVSVHDAGGQPTPDHIEVALQ